jgi:hypothetical protein
VIAFSEAPTLFPSPPHLPDISQHNDHALREMLGMSDEEITELVIDEALE